MEFCDKLNAQPLADAGDAEPEKARGKADVIKIEALMELDCIARDGRHEKADGNAGKEHCRNAPPAGQMHQPEAHQRGKTRGKQRLVDIF